MDDKRFYAFSNLVDVDKILDIRLNSTFVIETAELDFGPLDQLSIDYNDYSQQEQKPVTKVRQDISEEELPFINNKTTPTELQNKLGAPHKDCYDDSSYKKYAMYPPGIPSNIFLYRLTSKGILEVIYWTSDADRKPCVNKAIITYGKYHRKTLVDDDE